MSEQAPTEHLELSDPEPREPLPDILATRLALGLTQPKRRTDEFNTIRAGGSVSHTDNPAAMLGLAVGWARREVRRLAQKLHLNISLLNNTQLAAKFELNNGPLGQFLGGRCNPSHHETQHNWYKDGHRMLCELFLGSYCNSDVPDERPEGVSEQVWTAWERVNRVLFRSRPGEEIPRFFRGLRRTWSGAWSISELVLEIERLRLHHQWLGEPCELVMVSGGCEFPQTDPVWATHDPGDESIASATLDALRSGVKLRFIYPNFEQNKVADSYRKFAEQFGSFSGSARGEARPVSGVTFFNQVLQFISLRAGSDETLLILRGLDRDQPKPDDPISSPCTNFELTEFRGWLGPDSMGNQKKPPHSGSGRSGISKDSGPKIS